MSSQYPPTNPPGSGDSASKPGPPNALPGIPPIGRISFGSVFADQQAAYRDALRRARSEYVLGNYAAAGAVLEEVTKTAEVQISQAPPEEKAEWAERAQLAALAFTWLARVHARMGRIVEILPAAKRAVELFEAVKTSGLPLAGEAVNEYGLALHAAGRVEEALAALRAAESLGAATGETYLYLGLAARDAGDLIKAEVYLKKAEILETDDLQAARLEALAQVLEQQGAEKYTETVRAYSELAMYLAQLNRPEAMLAAVDHILDSPPDGLGFPGGLSGQEVDVVLEVLHVYRARAHFQLTNYEAAVEAADRALALNADNAEALGYKGQALFQLEQVEESEQLIRRALAGDPENQYLMATLGVILHVRGRYNEALETFTRSAAIGFESVPQLAPLVQYYIGNTQFQLGNHPEALAVMDKILAEEPEHALALEYKGRSLFLLGKYEEAAEALEKALAHTPDSVLLWATLAVSLYSLNRYEEALPAFERAEAIGFAEYPNIESLTLQYKGQTLYFLDRDEDAIQVLDRVLQADPDNVDALLYKARAQNYTNHTAEAIETIDRLLELDPQHKEGWKNKATWLMRVGRNEEALAALERALELDLGNIDLLDSLASALYLVGRYEESIEIMDRVLSQDPERLATRGQMGDALRLLEKHAEALAMQDEVLAKDPKNAYALASKGYTLIEMGRESEGIVCMDLALELEPNYTWALAGKAWALTRLDLYREARDLAQKVIELDPGYAWARGLHATILCEMADYTGAKQGLVETARQDGRISWVFGNLGEVYVRLAQQESSRDEARRCLEKAVEAYRRAIELDRDDLWLPAGLAEAKRCLGEPAAVAEAGDIYRQVIEDSKKRASLESQNLEAVGWCCFRLAREGDEQAAEYLDDAERYLIESLASLKDRHGKRSLILTKLRLALVILCSGRSSLAHKEYERAIDLAQSQQPEVRRDLFNQALFYLKEAIDERPEATGSGHTKRILERLEQEYHAALA